MLKRSLFLMILLILGVSAVQAQEGPQREIYTALAYGDAIFEPELWLAQATEQMDRTTAGWASAEFGALAWLEYLHFPGGLRDMEAFFNEDWFTGIFENYDSWKLADQCEFEDGMVLRLFDVADDGVEYWMNYWTRQETETRVLAFFMVFPKESLSGLEEYSERFDPAATSCEPG